MPTTGSPQLLETRARAGLVAVDGRAFPLKGAKIEARAEGGLASTTLFQEYENPHAEPLEVLYTLPLPADGAVLGYTIRLGERTITGQIEKREVAREKYLRALEEGRAAGLLEQDRADTFTQQLGSLPPGVPVRVEIEVLHPLAFRVEAGTDGPRWEYRFPTVVGVRYEGAPGRVPDAGRLDVDRADGPGTPVRLEVGLVIADGTPEGVAPLSPGHELAVSGQDGATRIALASPSRLDRDVVVRWRAAGSEAGARLVEGRGLAGDDGRYAVVTLTPPAAPSASFAQDVTILIDASGSMSGEPIEQAKRIAEALVASLKPADRFELLAFASTVTPLTRGWVQATESGIHAAVCQLRKLQASGATEMREAILRALEPLRSEAQRQVVLITDGEVGFEQEVVAEVLTKLPAGARLHVVGIGSAPNRTLTRGASRAGRGIELLVGNHEDANEAAARLRRATEAPVLADVAVRGSAVAGVAPERPRDVFAGQPALIAVELKPEGGTVEIEGRLAGQAAPWIERIEVPALAEARPASSLPAGAFYGREAVEDCEMRLAAADAGKGSRAMLERIEAVALRHRIVSRSTSLVAVSEDPTVDPRDPRRRQRLAVELPAEVSAEGVGLACATGMPRFAASMLTLGGGMDEEPLRERLMVDFDTTGAEEKGTYACQSSPPAWRAKSLRMLSGLFRRGTSGQPLHLTIEGRVVRVEPDLLVLEFEVPDGGIQLPPDGSEVHFNWDTRETTAAIVVEQLGTRAGEHAEGLTVRLALRGDLRSSGGFVTWDDPGRGTVILGFEEP